MNFLLEYITLGILVALFLFINAEAEKQYFTQVLKFKSFKDIVTNEVVVGAFLCIVIGWPIALLRLILSYLP